MDELTELEKELTEVIKKAKYSWLNAESSMLSESQWLAKAAASLCRETCDKIIDFARSLNGVGEPLTKKEILDTLNKKP